MRKEIYILLVGLACTSCSTPHITRDALLNADPRLKYHQPAELWKHSELVVLARPTTSRNIGIEESFKGCCVPHLKCECLQTEFEVELVFKGDDTLKTLSFLHYQIKKEEDQPFRHGCLFGPAFAYFD